jgi:hypothetical protein
MDRLSERSPHWFVLGGSLAFALAVCGCRDTDGGHSGSDGGAVHQDADPASCVEPKSQTLSEPCCLAFGADACGGGLFCAAFDGRTQPTCYPERSRADMSTCAEDRHCVSGQCNTTAGACSSIYGGPCSVAIGCAASPQGKRSACDARETPPNCRLVGDGSAGSVCELPSDCLSGHCTGSHCNPGLGDECESAAECVEGTCMECDGRTILCASGHTKECLSQCAVSEQYGPVYSRCAGAGEECWHPNVVFVGIDDCMIGASCMQCDDGDCAQPSEHDFECLVECSPGVWRATCS